MYLDFVFFFLSTIPWSRHCQCEKPPQDDSVPYMMKRRLEGLFLPQLRAVMSPA